MIPSEDSDTGYSSIDEAVRYALPGQKTDYIPDIPEGYKVPGIKDFTVFMQSLPVQRVPQHMLGYGVLGRCYTGSRLIQIRDDLYGKDFQEVDVHEQKHAVNPGMSEPEVRLWTRTMLGYGKYN